VAGAPTAGGGGQGSDGDGDGEDRDVQGTRERRQPGQQSRVVEHRFGHDEEGQAESEEEHQALHEPEPSLLPSGDLGDEFLLPPGVPQRLVSPEEAHDEPLEVARLGVDPDHDHVGHIAELGQRVARRRPGSRTGAGREGVGESAGSLEHDNRDAPVGCRSDLVDRDRAAAGEDCDHGLIAGEQVDGLEQERSLPAPLGAVREQEVRMVWLQLGPAFRRPALVIRERHLPDRGDPDDRDRRVARGCGTTEGRHDAGIGAAIDERRSRVGSGVDRAPLEQPLEPRLDRRIEGVRAADHEDDRPRRGESDGGEERLRGEAGTGRHRPGHVAVLEHHRARLRRAVDGVGHCAIALGNRLGHGFWQLCGRSPSCCSSAASSTRRRTGPSQTRASSQSTASLRSAPRTLESHSRSMR
jgi:hypothetical protein